MHTHTLCCHFRLPCVGYFCCCLTQLSKLYLSFHFLTLCSCEFGRQSLEFLSISTTWDICISVDSSLHGSVSSEPLSLKRASSTPLLLEFMWAYYFYQLPSFALVACLFHSQSFSGIFYTTVCFVGSQKTSVTPSRKSK